ncbi:hypothetical protein SAMN05421780_105205 [Flexibacter flexilis DSM 6793]|uniref:DUF4397 domain-containing protein n=1 Tax=Flexibacter flexilis DSM 6793 TaxID=927664 RepID=A0A1I1JDI2_9BACT|nr:hypothetical protein [Flexibacter flexilis]SFC43500.1 hypothetical protein SAMN05421780_105205 [Flexibacter flexilis DSM 6793]
MKKFAIYAFALFASATTLTSCGDDDETTPKVATNLYTAKIVGAQTATAGSFLSTSKGEVYLTSDSANFTANKVDVSFAQIGGDFTPTFISLDSRAGKGLTKVVTNTATTYFRESTLTKAQFDTAAAYIKGITSSASKTQSVAQGKVYEVVSSVGGTTTKALLYVSNLTTTSSNTTGSVTVDVKTVK